MPKRHEIPVLRRAEHTWSKIAALSGAFERRPGESPQKPHHRRRQRRRSRAPPGGSPLEAEAYREVLVKALAEDPGVRLVELLHRAQLRLAGYTGGKSALYALAQTLRVRTLTPMVRFEARQP